MSDRQQNEQTVEQEAIALRTLLHRYNYEYYALDAPSVMPSLTVYCAA